MLYTYKRTKLKSRDILKTSFVVRNVVLTMLRITYRHGRYRRMHRNGWRIGHRSSCCSRSCPLCYQTVCPPRTLYTWCRRSKPHANVYPCTTDPEIQHSNVLALHVFFSFFSLWLIFLSDFYFSLFSVILCKDHYFAITSSYGT